jgi:hypothetical protein
MRIELDQNEMIRAGMVGLRRQVESIVSKREPQFPESRPAEMFSTHIIGAMAELAAAKALGLPWAGHINHFNQPDLTGYGLGIEVRWSGQPRTIKVKPADAGDLIVVLVTGQPPVFHVEHFTRARTAKAKVPAKSPRPGKPAHFLPIEEAHPIDLLVTYIQARAEAARAAVCGHPA